MLQAANTFYSNNITLDLILALIGSGGVIGSIVALLKIRPESNSAAVAQAQGAIETMKMLNDELVEALDRAQVQTEELRRQCAALQDQLLVSEETIKRLRIELAHFHEIRGE